MENKNNNLWISFVDASGTFGPDDRYFGVGMLTTKNPGPITDKLHIEFQRIMAVSQTYKNQKIDALSKQEKWIELMDLLKRTKKSELKFDRLSPVKFNQYKEIIRIFLAEKENRFAVMVIDRKHPNFNSKFFSTTWDAYTSYLATLVSRELTNLPGSKMFLILDELPKPKQIKKSLEEIVLEKIQKQCSKKHDGKKICCIEGAIRVESHSNLLLQLCDILLGAVMFDYKQSAGYLSDKLQKRKEEVVTELRKGLGQPRLNKPFTIHKPVYFHVWNAEWNKNK